MLLVVEDAGTHRLLLVEAKTNSDNAFFVDPRSFLAARGAKGRALKPAQRLLDALNRAFGVDARLATWDPTTRPLDAWTGYHRTALACGSWGERLG